MLKVGVCELKGIMLSIEAGADKVVKIHLSMNDRRMTEKESHSVGGAGGGVLYERVG